MKVTEGENANIIAETVKTALATIEGEAKNTTQLVKAKILLIWCQQKFDGWKKEADPQGNATERLPKESHIKL